MEYTMQLEAYFRRKGALKKSEFADSIGMSRSYLSRLLRGDRVAGERWINVIHKVSGGLVRPVDLNPQLVREQERAARENQRRRARGLREKR